MEKSKLKSPLPNYQNYSQKKKRFTPHDASPTYHSVQVQYLQNTHK